MVINEKVFKAYDIRGVYPEEIDEELAYLVGKAFVSHLKCRSVVIGRDMRTSSQRLFDSLAKGMTEMGADVTDIGMVTTPMLNFAVAHLKFDGGIMVSASHNPGKYNAFKMIRPPALQMGAGSGMEEIKTLVVKGEFKDSANKGDIHQKDILETYLEHVRKFTENIKDLNIVADYGNGVGAISARPLFDSLPVDIEHLYPEPDGSFPNHDANP
ncbi:phosphomannomutase/phosphoglucomutase, partial [Candidatus Woesearchaeota archaeon]|nr:phosphomannomutase/phosphoglucomutase [Candidatus Woesearchaeota archaeon]